MDVKNARGDLVLQSSRLWQLSYGTPARLLEATPLVRPALDVLCTGHPEQAQWRGAIVLGDDWSTPGCSMETRERVAQDAVDRLCRRALIRVPRRLKATDAKLLRRHMMH